MIPRARGVRISQFYGDITKAPILLPFPNPQDEGNIICPECARKKIMAEMEERNE